MNPPRIYISGPLQAAKDLAVARSFYERLARICTEAGAEPYLPHKRTDPALHDDAHPVQVFRRDCQAIKQCDLLIAHIGHPSSGVGAELGLAFSAKQPIIAIYRESERPSRFILGMLEDYEAATVISFGNEKALASSLDRAIAEQLNRAQRRAGSALRRIA
ncbi:MAG TPA: nucleoside 2-deoxyribosyltransferase [Solirubrobacterales bacterium]|nr:nucleoside 2-deoxyribosyltransferase [Solirubrobacterales bacterium]